MVVSGEFVTIMKVTPSNVENATKTTSKNQVKGVMARRSKFESITGDMNNTGSRYLDYFNKLGISVPWLAILRSDNQPNGYQTAV